jgi:hypothetical protein
MTARCRHPVLLPALAAALCACRSLPVEEVTVTGSVEMALLAPPPGATRMALATNQRFIYPNLEEPVAMPAYPPELLPLRLPPLELCVDVVIGEEGMVRRVQRRIDDACPGEAGPHEARFAQLLEAALLQWTYAPALVCSTPDGRPSEDVCAEPDVVETPVAVRLSYAFGFSQQDGEPVVELRGGGSQAR